MTNNDYKDKFLSFTIAATVTILVCLALIMWAAQMELHRTTIANGAPVAQGVLHSLPAVAAKVGGGVGR